MARFYAGVYPAFHWEEYRRLLELFQADPKKRLSALSKGLRRQAAMLLALSCRTPCLLLDEVFDGLDPVARRKVKKLLYQEIDARGVTVVISSHDLRELEDLCDRVALLHRGQIRLERGLDELKQGFCKVQAAFRQPVDWGETGLDILERQQQGDLASLLVRGGVTPLEALGGVVSPVRGITTRTSTGGAPDTTWRELTTILIVDEVIPSIRRSLRSRFSKTKNTAQTRGAIRSQVIVELESKLRAETIDSYGDVSVSVYDEDPTVCLVEFSFAVAHGLNQIYLTAHITI